MWMLASLLALGAAAVAPAPKEFSIDLDKRFYLRADAVVVVPDALVDDRHTLLAPVSELLDGAPRVLPASQLNRVEPALYIATVSQPGALDKRRLRRFRRAGDQLPPSGFRLSIERQGIVIVGADTRGVWHGLHALAALAEEHGANLPYVQMKDWPALSVRGAYLRTLPSEADLRRLAALRATHLLLESDDFYNLSGVRADAWGRAAAAIRDHQMEPIPIFATLDGMGHVLRDHPMLIEGRAVTEAIPLYGVGWASLRYPNILAERAEDIFVSISGVPCVHGRDYWLDGPPILAPFHPEGPRWRIRRELEGAIPDGGTATLAYSYATADSSSLAFAAPEARPWLEERLGRLITVLEPRYIHLDHGAVGRLNTDTRSLRAGLSRPDRFLQSLALLEEVIGLLDPEVTLMMWADLINPGQSATIYGLDGVAPQIPGSVQVLGRAHIDSTADVGERLDSLGRGEGAPAIVGVAGSTGAIHRVVQRIAARGESGGGIIALDGEHEAQAVTLAAAWSGPDGGGLWLELLNGYFGTDLVHPDYLAVRAALAAYVNAATLQGRAPADVFRDFDLFSSENRARLERDAAAAVPVRELLSQLTSYLALESDFSRGGGDAVLQELQMLVEAVRGSDPAPDAERYGRIIDTIAGQGLFVPASILFQEDLRYYRPWPAKRPLYEVPAQPAYQDRQGQIVAAFNLMAGQAPIRRIDFEALGVESLALALPGGDGAYGEHQRWGGAPGQVRGPVRVDGVGAAAGLRLTAAGAASPLVLREVRLFAEKVDPEITVHYAVQSPAMVPRFEGRSWAAAPQGHSFVSGGARQFAEAPTAVWVTHTRDALYVGIAASETRPETIVADFATHDAPLWEQESVEIWLQPEGRLPLRLIVSPRGTRYDSEAFDGGWDGEWSAAAEQNDQGWSAVVRIPAELTGTLVRGAEVPINFVRNRLGVRRERSVWAHEYGARPDLQWGTLRFP